MELPDLRGKTAVVTGGGRGIGRAIARMLGEAGARVVVTARTASQIEVVAREIESDGGQAVAIAADMARTEAVRAMIAQVSPVDIVINNAGIVQPVAPVVYADPEEWRYNIAVNLDSVFLTCHFSLPAMIERRWGRIVNITSGAARGSVTSWSAYSAAKAGVEVFTKVLAEEVAAYGIRANSVRPGIVDTEMQHFLRGTTEEQFGRENLERFRGYKERGLLRRPEDPARLVLWLLTPEADEINGQVLAIDDPEVAARIGLTPMGR